MDRGYIKLYRCIQDEGWWRKSKYVHLWVYLLLRAAHKGRDVLLNGEIVRLAPGQFVTGRKEISKDTGIKESTIESILNLFETGHQIGQQKTTKYRIITITNWDKFQKLDIKMDNKRTTNGQQTDTNKNDKNVKNKEYLSQAFLRPTKDEVEKYCLERKNNVSAEKWLAYYESNGWRVGKNPMKNWKAAVRTWEQNNIGGKNEDWRD